MSGSVDVREAFKQLRSVLQDRMPEVASELRPPMAFDVEWGHRPGAEEVLTLWSVTSGQREGILGLCGGLRVLGPHESEQEREKWSDLLAGPAFEAVANPTWDNSKSLDPHAVRGVYFAAGWIPVLSEPFEANYLAVDLVPLPGGRPGQVILCGRDEDEKLVVAPNLATLFDALADECGRGQWEMRNVSTSNDGTHQVYLERLGGRLLSDCRKRTFPSPPDESVVSR